MSDRTRKAIVFGAAGIALVWVFFNSPFMDDDTQPMMNDTMTEVVDNQMGVTEVNQSTHPSEVTGEWQGDPFPRQRAVRRTETVSKPAETFKLTAISKSGSSYMAIINGSVLSEGESIGSWHVDAINHNSVVLSSGSAKRVFKLGR